MKSAIVPAQITTVEDKIAGNLTLQQMFLLAIPVFIDFVLYVVLPRSLKLSAYKVVLMTLVALVCFLLAIRIKGKILLIWAMTIIRYNARPRYYVFNKNDAYLRDSTIALPPEEPSTAEQTAASVEESELPLAAITMAEAVKLEGILANPAAKLSFSSRKKGGLHVCITEVK
jgi:hypothetical protein